MIKNIRSRFVLLQSKNANFHCQCFQIEIFHAQPARLVPPILSSNLAFNSACGIFNVLLQRCYCDFFLGDVRFLICTDAAARGIDIKGLPFVVNVTLPDKPENYIHRVGRVGRADARGLAISLVTPHREKVWYHSNCKDRGRNCTNTNLIDAGGCCIWYDELDLLKQVKVVGYSFKVDILFCF